jgi:hypothetical protein
MKTVYLILVLPLAVLADDDSLADKIGKHQTGARELSEKQDELAADVQQLTIEQTVPKVIELLREVEDAMDEASERLWEHETGGETIAAETDVIEKIYAAAKEKQKQCSDGSCSGGMLGMMERMMGKEPGGQKPGKKPGDKGGEGMTGDSDSANQQQGGSVAGKVEERRVPKGSGSAGKTLPREFQDALRAYNRGAEEIAR